MSETGAPGVDAERVGRYLARELADLCLPISVHRIGNGQSNITALVSDAAGATWVLRRPPLGPLLPSAHDVAREYRVLVRLAAAGAPVPKPALLCTDEAITRAPFFVMEHVEGIVPDEDEAGAWDAGLRRQAGTSLVDALAAIHALDVDAVGLGDLSRRDDYAARQVRRWRRQWDASKTRELPLVDELAERLAAAAPEQTEVVLVHGDFRLDNAIVGRAGRVKAILDWELCTLGDPLADVGMAIAYTPRGRNEVLPTHDGVALLPGFLAPAELAARYAATTGRDISLLPYWIALGCWKLAVILEGVHRRWLDNPANGGRGAGELRPAVEQLVRRAGEAATEASI